MNRPDPASLLSDDDDGAPLRAELLPHGALLRLMAGDVMLNAYPGNLVEGGPANLWLRQLQGAGAPVLAHTPLLGPRSPLQPCAPGDGCAWRARGTWRGLAVTLQLRLAHAAWFWHLAVHHTGDAPVTLDLLHVQDVGLAPLATLRLNEYYVSHYIDLAPLAHPRLGTVIAARQNQAVAGRHPWLLMGALGGAAAYATDALQVLGTAQRMGDEPPALREASLPSRRLQHEHALAALQTRPATIAPGAEWRGGFFGVHRPHHAEASGDADLALADAALALPEARPPADEPSAGVAPDVPPPSLFATAAPLAVDDLEPDRLDTLFGRERRHVETDGAGGALLSFFHGADAAHVVLHAKEARVLRPHGHLLRSGRHGVPDETALTSTAWMAGVFHSMVTQGHVGINRFLSTVRGQLGQFGSMGQRVFVDAGDGWRLLGVPSAFEMRADTCRWLYRHAGGLLEVTAGVLHHPHALTLQLRVLQGAALSLRVVQHVVLAGDHGLPPEAPPAFQVQPDGSVFVPVPPGSELARRFPEGGFALAPAPGSRFDAIEGDAALWPDGVPRGQALICLDARAAPTFALRITGHLVTDVAPPPPLALQPPALLRPLPPAAEALADTLPWFGHNALVHHLAPRGLEQFSGGGWGTRDVCQGPLEMLLALDQPAPVRDLLQRVFVNQNADGDWPQWFMFFERERAIRAGDSHGDIVFWPLVGLARYLIATADAALLDAPLPYFDAPAEPLLAHVERALALIRRRRIAGTALAAYGHGDWNDSLQPADPALREHLCSAWTVTLHHQALTLLAQALARCGREAMASALRDEAAAVRTDFQRWLVADGVVTGYALFDGSGDASHAPELLLHPRDTRTGLAYSLLPMMHAVLEDLLPREQALHQAALIERHLNGPDGARLFDRPLPYRGGPMRLFQRAESSAFFGREIGVMYMHAHLRWAEMLAHLGQAHAFVDALRRACPVALQAVVPQATLRQANAYFSSSDAAFADRHEASRDYDRAIAGEVPLDGGWRVYSSGPGIAIGLVVGRLLGVRREHDAVVFDPVLPASWSGLVARLQLAGHEVTLELQPGALGHGPTAVTLDGAALPFVRVAHACRTGGARVALDELRAPLAAPGAHRVVVTTA
jgi:cellobiose phosphorylase